MKPPISTPKTQRERADICLRWLASTGQEFSPALLAHMSGITSQWANRLCHAAARRGELDMVCKAQPGVTHALFRGPQRAAETKR